MNEERTIKVGVYTFILSKVDGNRTLVVKNPGGVEVAKAEGGTFREAGQRIIDSTSDNGLKNTLNPTVLPEF